MSLASTKTPVSVSTPSERPSESVSEETGSVEPRRHLRPVRPTVAVRVREEGIGPRVARVHEDPRARLDAVGEPVRIGVGEDRVEPRGHLLPVEEEVSVGIGAQGVGAGVVQVDEDSGVRLDAVEEPVRVRVRVQGIRPTGDLRAVGETVGVLVARRGEEEHPGRQPRDPDVVDVQALTLGAVPAVPAHVEPDLDRLARERGQVELRGHEGSRGRTREQRDTGA